MNKQGLMRKGYQEGGLSSAASPADLVAKSKELLAAFSEAPSGSPERAKILEELGAIRAALQAVQPDVEKGAEAAKERNVRREELRMRRYRVAEEIARDAAARQAMDRGLETPAVGSAGNWAASGQGTSRIANPKAAELGFFTARGSLGETQGPLREEDKARMMDADRMDPALRAVRERMGFGSREAAERSEAFQSEAARRVMNRPLYLTDFTGQDVPLVDLTRLAPTTPLASDEPRVGMDAGGLMSRGTRNVFFNQGPYMDPITAYEITQMGGPGLGAARLGMEAGRRIGEALRNRPAPEQPVAAPEEGLMRRVERPNVDTMAQEAMIRERQAEFESPLAEVDNERVAEFTRALADFAPGIGDALGIKDAYETVTDPNASTMTKAAALGLASLGFVPLVGDAVAAPARAAMKQADALRIQESVTDPTTDSYARATEMLKSPDARQRRRLQDAADISGADVPEGFFLDPANYPDRYPSQSYGIAPAPKAAPDAGIMQRPQAEAAPTRRVSGEIDKDELEYLTDEWSRGNISNNEFRSQARELGVIVKGKSLKPDAEVDDIIFDLPDGRVVRGLDKI